MGTSRILAAAIIALSLAACADKADLQIASLDQKCAAISDTGDMYRYCLQEGPAQVAALTSGPSSDIVVVTASARAR